MTICANCVYGDHVACATPEQCRCHEPQPWQTWPFSYLAAPSGSPTPRERLHATDGYVDELPTAS